MVSVSAGDTPSVTPVVSVVLATYRRQDVLPQAIQSVLEQTLEAWELLVVDDEPSDETRAAVESFDDPRIRYLRHEHNRGLCAARNTGITSARSRYLAFLDDDDLFLPTKLERQVRELDQAAQVVGVVSCGEEIRTSDGNVTIRVIPLNGDVHRQLLENDLIRMQPLMVRRVCFDRVGLFDTRLRMHDDFDMTLRLSRLFQFVTIAEPLVRIMPTHQSMSTNVQTRIDAIEIIMSTHPEFREDGRVRGRWERRLARHHGELGRIEEWRRHLRRSLEADPTSLETWMVLGFGSLLGPRAHLRLAQVRGQFSKATRNFRNRMRKTS